MQSAHAYVTASFKIKFDDGNSINSASLVYGGLHTGKVHFSKQIVLLCTLIALHNCDFLDVVFFQEFHAKKTEQFLVGKNLTNIEVRKGRLFQNRVCLNLFVIQGGFV